MSMRQSIKDGYKTSDSLNKKKPSTGYSPAITQSKGNSQQLSQQQQLVQQQQQSQSTSSKTPLQNLIYKNIKLNLNELQVNKHVKSNSVNPPQSSQQNSIMSGGGGSGSTNNTVYQNKPSSQHMHGHKGSIDSSMYNKYMKMPQGNSKIAFSQPQSIIGSPKNKKRDDDILLLQQQLKQSNIIPSSSNHSQHSSNPYNQPQQSLSSQHSQHSQSNSQSSNTNERNKPANFLNYLMAKEQPVRNKSKNSDIQQQPNSTGSTNQNSKISINKTSSNNQQQQSKDEDDNQMSMKNMFIYHYVIGKGGFGKVWKVEHKKSRQFFALKEMSKALIITKKSVPSVMNERNLLSILKHPFLVNMFYAYQDRDNLYLIMDLMPGGDLRYHIGRQRRFSEEQTRFFVCCIFLGLEYLHNNNIIHRDIKPENLVLDQQGYVRITDLGIARVWKADNANDTSGTPGYMAPEVMCRQPHTFAVDYFALGVLAYEFMLGRRPYLGRSRKEIRDTILAKRVQIKKQEIPPGWSLEAADFINRMIERKPLNRLGINGPAEVKNHPWIKNFPWQKLERKELSAPFIPSKSDNFDAKQQITVEDEQNAEIIAQNALLLKTNSLQSLFNGYNYDGSQLLFQELNRQTPSTQSSSSRMAFQQNASGINNNINNNQNSNIQSQNRY